MVTAVSSGPTVYLYAWLPEVGFPGNGVGRDRSLAGWRVSWVPGQVHVVAAGHRDNMEAGRGNGNRIAHRLFPSVDTVFPRRSGNC